MIVPTVKVLGGSKGYRLINAADYDPAVHVLADSETKERAKARKAKGAA